MKQLLKEILFYEVNQGARDEFYIKKSSISIAESLMWGFY